MASNAPSAHLWLQFQRYNAFLTDTTDHVSRLRLMPMPGSVPDESSVERRRRYLRVDTLELVAKARAGDDIASDVLCERYTNLLRRWARMRLSSIRPDPDAHTLDSVEHLVRDATQHTIERLREFDFDIEREGTLLLELRAALHGRLGSTNETPDALELTMGAQTATQYESCLTRLPPLEREAIVSVLEFQRSFDQLASALNVSSTDCAREKYRDAVVHLAEEMSHGR